MILTSSNFLSLLRGFLAFIFLSDNVFYRAAAIVGALLTDYFDGYLARRTNSISRFGTILDPLMDKFFVGFILIVFLQEHKIELWEAIALLSRDIALFFFGLYLSLKRKWGKFYFHAIWTGKVTTTLQFFVLLSTTFGVGYPTQIYPLFILLGILAFIELYYFPFYPKQNEVIH